jgi:nicotinate-nucleotide adenylyltransferase
MKTGLFFGSFNPIHVGHLIIANFMATRTDLQEVWMVVSPHNPLKEKKGLAKDYDRLHLVHLAIGDNNRLKASNIEFQLPKPSYTVDTLAYLKERHQERQFVLIMGTDNLQTLEKWKNFEVLLRDYSIYAYRRPEFSGTPFDKHPAVRIFEAPMMSISATYIRSCIQSGDSIQYLVPDAVKDYIDTTNMYK